MPKQFVEANNNLLLPHQANGGEDGTLTGVIRSGTVKGTISREIANPIKGTSSWKFAIPDWLAGDDCNLTFATGANEASLGFAVPSNTLFDFQALVRVPAGASSVSLRIIQWASDGAVVADTSIQTVNNPAGLVQLQASLRTAPRTARISLRIRCNGIGDWIVDDLSIRRAQLTDSFANLAPLFTDAAWVKHANAQASPDGTTLTLNATASNQLSTLDITVTRGMTLQFSVKSTGGRVEIGSMLSGSLWDGGGPASAATVNGTFQITVTPTTGTVRINLFSLGVGTFTFSNLTLCRAASSHGELVTNGDFSQGATGWSVHANASVVGGQLVLNAPTSNNSSTQNVSVTPNTRYSFRVTSTASASTATVDLQWGSIMGSPNRQLRNDAVLTLANGDNQTFITTLPGQTSLIIGPSNVGAGTFTFDNISFKRAMPDDFFKELVVNGDFSQGTTGWTLTSVASVVNGQVQITGNTSVGFPEVVQYIPVTPSTPYEISADVGGSSPNFDVWCHATETGVSLAPAIVTRSSSFTRQQFTTLPGCYIVRLKLSRSVTTAGTATLDNVSLKKALPT